MGIMLVYDITNAKSFENISKWLRNIDEVSLHTTLLHPSDNIRIDTVIQGMVFKRDSSLKNLNSVIICSPSFPKPVWISFVCWS